MRKLLILLLTLSVCGAVLAKEKSGKTFKVQKTDAEWRKLLTEEQYQVLRGKGTERPFTSQCLRVKENGAYHCAGCNNLLFKSAEKFDSGTGWPSFTRPGESSSDGLVGGSEVGLSRAPRRLGLLPRSGVSMVKCVGGAFGTPRMPTGPVVAGPLWPITGRAGFGRDLSGAPMA